MAENQDKNLSDNDNIDTLIEKLSEFKYDENALGVLVLKFSVNENPYFEYFTKDNAKYKLGVEEIVGSIEFMKQRIVHDTIMMHEIMDIDDTISDAENN